MYFCGNISNIIFIIFFNSTPRLLNPRSAIVPMGAHFDTPRKEYLVSRPFTRYGSVFEQASHIHMYENI